MIRPLSLVAALALMVAGAASADTLYRQDFEKGVAPEWGAAGEGDVRLSAYAGNISLKFAGHALSRTEVATRSFRNIVVRTKIAALDLGPSDACYAEASADDGASWIVVQVIRKGQDDGATLVSAAVSDPRFDGQAKLLLEFRADLSNPGAVCWGDDVDIQGAAPVATRSSPLDAATLAGVAPLTGLTAISGFLPGPNAQWPTPRLEGRLELHPSKAPDGLAVLTDTAPTTGKDTRGTWPTLSVDLVQDGARILPVHRGPLMSDSPDWDWVVEPGEAWTDPADGGFSRLLLPVALEERNANCLHTGRMLLLFKADGTVSRAALQFDSDTCAYYRFDAWSLTSAAYRPGPVAGADAVIARDRAERAGRPALKPLEALASDHPGLDISALARAAGPSAVFGLFDGATHYAGPCHTRAGDDPFCAERPLPSYSTAKSLVAAQALFRLESLRPGTISEKVADHVPACVARGGWNDVRLIDLLDMASGHYDSAAADADENAPTSHAFFASTTEAEKVAFACGKPRKSAPGKVWVYHTFDTFLLGAALTDVMRKAGLGQDEYDSLIRPIWDALGQSPDLDHTRRTEDAAAQPFSGWGLIYHRDDAIRAARFLTSGGRIAGKPYLDEALLSQALQTSDPGGGFEATGSSFRYRHGFWARNIGSLIGCAHPVWTPFLSGFGGISLVLFPNGVVYYAFNDENQFDWSAAVPEINKIRSLCL